ncbi:hypothetical protein HOP38_02700 [Vibrio mediterranei]|uniref:hypothetical protein n=1 Tax=Vibrio mediterranei TaxID=689 RepID=UPI0017DBE59E|nr:hypothetical protein [Vibrio mediterranei]NUW71420.1 hypothetical protein [Vibrio mediterranei]
MAIEATTYIHGLNSANPSPSDKIGDAFRHIQLIKSALKNTFPNIDKATTITSDELNRVVSGLEAIETRLAATRNQLKALEQATPSQESAQAYAKTVAQVSLINGLVLLTKSEANIPQGYGLLNANGKGFINPPVGAPTTTEIQRFAGMVKGQA